jgi:hypothetical protein
VKQLGAAVAGQRNDVWLAESSNGTVVVRLLKETTRLAMEVALLARAAEAGIPVPTCLWSTIDPRPVMIQTAVRGIRPIAAWSPCTGPVGSDDAPDCPVGVRCVARPVRSPRPTAAFADIPLRRANRSAVMCS